MQNGFILNCSLGLHLPFSYLKSDYFHNSQSYERICTHFFDQSRFFQPIKTSKYINLFFFGSPFTFLETQILQCLSHRVFLCQQQDIIIQLKRIEHPEINADCHCRCAFLHAWEHKRRTSCTFRTWVMLRFLRSRAILICSPTICIFCSSFLVI